MSQVDLHIHSSASDGRLSPEEVARESARLGLKVIALTDHDTVAGVGPALSAARAFPELMVIPGVELSTDEPQGEVHVLGYFIDYTDGELVARLDRMRGSRRERAQAMIDRLGDLGVSIEWARVREIAGAGSVGRPHLAQAMLEKGYIGSLKEAFNNYIGRDGPAYVERWKLTPTAAVELVVRFNGLPVLAHPLTAHDPEAAVVRLKAAGLVGIEAYYKGYSAAEVGRLLGLADKYDLVVTGGSDYHGLEDETEVIISGADVPLSAAEQLIALARSQVPG